jgi:hypothetical protein
MVRDKRTLKGTVKGIQSALALARAADQGGKQSSKTRGRTAIGEAAAAGRLIEVSSSSTVVCI